MKSNYKKARKALEASNAPEHKYERELLKKCNNDKRLYGVAEKCRDQHPIEFELADYIDWLPGFADEIILCTEDEVEAFPTINKDSGVVDETVKPQKHIERDFAIYNPINGTLVPGFAINPRAALEEEYYSKEFHIRLKLLIEMVQYINKQSKNLDVSIDDFNKMCGFNKGRIEKYLEGTLPSTYSTYMLASALGCQMDVLAGPYRFVHFLPELKEKEESNG